MSLDGPLPTHTSKNGLEITSFLLWPCSTGVYPWTLAEEDGHYVEHFLPQQLSLSVS